MATPLEQRQWRQSAQRAVRVALTSIKDSQTRFEAAANSGQQLLSQICNNALTLSLLPTMKLGALQDMQDLKPTAEAKLRRQQHEALEGLQAQLQAIEACAKSMHMCVESLQQHACPTPQQLVFSTLTLPRTITIVQQVAAMYADEAANKRAVYATVSKQLGLGPEAATEQENQGSSAPSKLTHEQLQALSATWLSCWMLHPYLHEEKLQELVTGLTEDMHGF